MKTAIVYESKHHENTLKLVQAIAEKYDVDLIDVAETKSANLTKYELIGFASGIEYGGFYRNIASFAANWMPRECKVFLLYTCGKDNPEYTEELEQTAHSKNCQMLGKYGCLGFDTFGPFKLFGGKNKNHPTEEEIAGAVMFFGEIAGLAPAENKKSVS